MADNRLAHYFTKVIHQCNYDDGTIHCFCAETKDEFSAVFNDAGNIRCDNPFTEDTDYLVANVVLSAGCLVIAGSILLCFVVWNIGALCSTTCCYVSTSPSSPAGFASTPYQKVPTNPVAERSKSAQIV